MNPRDPGPPDDDAPDDESDSLGARVDRAVAQLVEEPLLWVLILVVLAHVAAFVAPTLLWALRERRLSAMAALALLIVLSIAVVQGEWQRKGRPGALAGLLAAAWLLSVGAALAAHRLGVF